MSTEMLETAHFERYSIYIESFIENTKSFFHLCKMGIKKIYKVTISYIEISVSIINKIPIIGNIYRILKNRLSIKPANDDSTKNPPDILQEYIDKQKKRLEKLYEPGIDNCVINRNISRIFYQKKEFMEYMKSENTDLEKEWKTRILFEYTPRGNIVMYYDAYKQGFAYYSDITMTYNVLNAVAMKYVSIYGCRDFFIDNQYREEESPLLEIYEKDTGKPKEEKESFAPKTDNKVFAKLKNYNTISAKVNAPTDKNTKNATITPNIPLKGRPATKIESLSLPKIALPVSETPIPDKIIWKNRFVYCGKMANYKILQKISIRSSKPIKAIPLGNIEKHDGEIESQGGLTKELLSYRAFKEMKQKLKNSVPNS